LEPIPERKDGRGQAREKLAWSWLCSGVPPPQQEGPLALAGREGQGKEQALTLVLGLLTETGWGRESCEEPLLCT